jgi:hypothetical protein
MSKISENIIDAEAAIKLQCCLCNKNISNDIKIILDPSSHKNKNHQKGLSFNALCVNCFILKTKFDPKNNVYYVTNEMSLNIYKYTNYRIITKMTEPLFTEDWSLGEEIKLLGAIEKMGLENWEDISNILNKGKLECESHYYTFYYKEKNDFLINDNTANINNKSIQKFEANKDRENMLLLTLSQNTGYIPFPDNDNNDTNNINNSNNNNNMIKIII